jgi:hypothetical protein
MRFSRFLIGLLVALAVTARLLLVVGTRCADQQHFLAALNDKVRLLDTAPGARLVLIGGSNLLFGVDSSELQASLGRPVCNFSLHAGLGLEYPLWLALPRLRNGDLVVICPEYFAAAANLEVLAQSALYYPEAAPFVAQRFGPLDQLRFHILCAQKAVGVLHSRFYLALGGNNRDPLFRRDISPQGDMIGHLDRPRPPGSLRDFALHPKDYSGAVALIEEFAAQAQQKGARVVFAYPTVCQSFWTQNGEPIGDFANQLAGMRCPIINTPMTFVYPDSLYYDTAYHLTREGRQRRTVDLLACLQPFLNGKER